MPSGTDKPHPPPDDASDTDQTVRELRFAQARSIGILLVLLALLGLILYNTMAEGTPWVHRARDVRLLMTLLSILLGLDVVIGNHRAIARIAGRVLIKYAEDHEPPRNRRYHPRDDTAQQRAHDTTDTPHDATNDDSD